MCVPDLSILKSAVFGFKGYNLGAIVARRLQNNSRKGNFFGGIYATCVANFLGIAPREGDMIMPLFIWIKKLCLVIIFLRGMYNSSIID